MSRNRLIMADLVIRKDLSKKDPEDSHLAEVGISLRVLNSLEDVGIFTIRDFLNASSEELAVIPNCGSKTIAEVRNILRSIGFLNFSA